MIELHPLIDVVDDASKREAMILLSNIISWLAITLDSNEEYKKYILKGFLVLYDEYSTSSTNSINALLFCEGTSQMGIMEILRNPLSQYKGKFLPSILIEPESVRVKTDDIPTTTTTSLDESSIAIEITDDSESEKDDDDSDKDDNEKGDPDEMQAKTNKKQKT